VFKGGAKLVTVCDVEVRILQTGVQADGKFIGKTFLNNAANISKDLS
jgi:hypothetical protein